MIVDTSHNRYISLGQGNILNIYFWWRKKHFKRLWKQNITEIESAELPTAEYWKKKKILKNEKVANRKLRNLWNLGNLGNIIPSFLISKFSILPYSQNRKLGFKNLGKKNSEFSEISELSEFSNWPQNWLQID